MEHRAEVVLDNQLMKVREANEAHTCKEKEKEGKLVNKEGGI